MYQLLKIAKFIFCLFVCFIFTIPLKAQFDFINVCELNGTENCLDIVSTAVPILRTTYDARTAAMGNVGIAISPDANSIFYNMSKMAFAEKNTGIALSYSPRLTGLVNDVNLSSLNGYFKITDKDVLAISLRHFSLGTLNFNDQNIPDRNFKPKEQYVDLGYSRKVNENLSLGAVLKYVNSNLLPQSIVYSIKPGRAIAADISVFYKKPIDFGTNKHEINFGASVSNIGNKVSYSDDVNTADFLPTNLGIGAAFNVSKEELQKFTIALDFNKLLVPTPQIDGSHRDLKGINAILTSFSDGNELQEIMTSIGTEFWYNKKRMVARIGYFDEHVNAGNRKFFTFGGGFKIKMIMANISFLKPLAKNHPLARTWNFSLSANF